MIKHIVILSFLGSFVIANKDVSSSNSNQPPKVENMNIKIKGIARGIVDKWVAEGLTITRDKVEGWISKLDEAQVKDSEVKNHNGAEVADENNKQKGQESEVSNLGGNFEDVKKTVVNTFTKIGQVKCENCKKSGEHDHDNKLSKETEANPKKQGDNLENFSVEELIGKQKTIMQFLEIEKMKKLANVAREFSKIGKLMDTTLAKPTAREEL